MEVVTDWIEKRFGLSPAFQENILASIIVIVVMWGLGTLLTKLVKRRKMSEVNFFVWRRGILYTTRGLMVLLLAQIWVEAFSSVATFLGLLSAGIAIALKDPLSNLAGWGMIIWRKTFHVGDRIQIGEFSGDVIDIRMFQFTLIEIGNWATGDQSTGRMVHIPNAKIFTEELANYSSGFEFIWHEMPVLVTFESDWKKTKAILNEILDAQTREQTSMATSAIKEAAKEYLIPNSDTDPYVFTSVLDSGVSLNLRYMVRITDRRKVAERIWEDILDRFAEHDDIDFAYPTTRFYQNFREGKPGTLPPSNPRT